MTWDDVRRAVAAPGEDWDDRPILVLDLETTGADPVADRIVAIDMVWLIHGRLAFREHLRCNVEGALSAEVATLIGISNDDVAHEPTFREVSARLATLMDGCTPCAYWASFDRDFLTAEIRRSQPLPAEVDRVLQAVVDTFWLDPLAWAYDLHGPFESHRLAAVAAPFGLDLQSNGGPTGDAELVTRLLAVLLPSLPSDYGELVSRQASVLEKMQILRRERTRRGP